MIAKNRVQMIGRKFGELTCVQENGKNDKGILYYLFTCSCGGEHVASGTNVRNGNVRWCKNCDKRHKPSPNRVPMVGRKFGELTCIEELGSILMGKSKRAKVLYCLCECSCGEKHKASASNLKRGKITKCPKCKYKDRISGSEHPQFKGYGEIPLAFWSSIAYRAKVKGIEFSITIEQAWELFLKQDRKCALTGFDLKMMRKAHKDNTATASLDRKDSKLGYMLGNLQWVHKHINAMKNEHGQDYFIMLCRSVVENAEHLTSLPLGSSAP